MIKQLDPTRLVNQASGWSYFGAGDVVDAHHYPEPVCPAPSADQALVCGEYGGIGLRVDGHIWQRSDINITAPDALIDQYMKYAQTIVHLRDNNGLSAAVYTEITDTEFELVGLLTYDRLMKCDPAGIAKANNLVIQNNGGQ
jgi:hypothetical protein